MIKRMNDFMGRHKTVSYVAADILFAGMVLLVTVGCGTIHSGWHFVDDHEFLEWINPVREGRISAAGQMEYLFMNGFHGRFRPLYAPTRFLTILLFGTDIHSYAVLKAVETILAFFLLFVLGEKLSGRFVPSVAFSLISLTGYQSAIWWKLGPQELQGTISFALGMIFLEEWLRKEKKGYGVLSFFFFWMMSNWKESFVLLLPFVFVYVIYRTKDGKPENGIFTRCLCRMRMHWLYLSSVFLLFAAIIGIIVFKIGTNESSGGGVSASIGIGTIINNYYYAAGHDLKYYAGVSAVLAAVLLTFWDDLKRMWKEILLLFIFIGPQLLLYGKEAMAERYIVPFSVGYGLFFIIAVSNGRILAGKRKWVYQLALLLLFALGLRTTLIEADYFRYRGESITSLMDYIRDVSQNDPSVTVMSCLGYSNPEADNTVAAWMEYYGEEEHMYYWDEGNDTVRDFRAQAVEKDDAEYSLDEMKVVIAYNATDRHYTGKCKPVREQLLESDYTLFTNGSVDIYVRNGMDIPAPSADIKSSFYE